MLKMILNVYMNGACTHLLLARCLSYEKDSPKTGKTGE